MCKYISIFFHSKFYTNFLGIFTTIQNICLLIYSFLVGISCDLSRVLHIKGCFGVENEFIEVNIVFLGINRWKQVENVFLESQTLNHIFLVIGCAWKNIQQITRQRINRSKKVGAPDVPSAISKKNQLIP